MITEWQKDSGIDLKKCYGRRGPSNTSPFHPGVGTEKEPGILRFDGRGATSISRHTRPKLTFQEELHQEENSQYETILGLYVS